jgi:hypothetical protein
MTFIQINLLKSPLPLLLENLKLKPDLEPKRKKLLSNLVMMFFVARRGIEPLFPE